MFSQSILSEKYLEHVADQSFLGAPISWAILLDKFTRTRRIIAREEIDRHYLPLFTSAEYGPLCQRPLRYTDNHTLAFQPDVHARILLTSVPVETVTESSLYSKRERISMLVAMGATVEQVFQVWSRNAVEASTEETDESQCLINVEV